VNSRPDIGDARGNGRRGVVDSWLGAIFTVKTQKLGASKEISAGLLNEFIQTWYIDVAKNDMLPHECQTSSGSRV
jgi:hypothetical protein